MTQDYIIKKLFVLPSLLAIFILKNLFYKFWCGLHRKYTLSGISLYPNWIPSMSIASAENQIFFHLQLMTGMITLTFFFFF